MDDEPPGVPEWVVTYGDMMSLLLTFFIMLVSLSEVVADEKYRAIMEAIHSHLGYQGGPIAPPGKSFPLNSVIDSMREMKLGSVSNEHRGKGGVKQDAPPGDDLRVTRLRQGNGQLAGPAIFFASGKSELLEEGRLSAAKTAESIAGKPHKLEIRAFTDKYLAGIPQTHNQRMNLAYERAHKVMEVMLGKHISRNRIRIVVHFQSTNKEHEQVLEKDRVEITTLDEYASTFIGHEDDYR